MNVDSSSAQHKSSFNGPQVSGCDQSSTTQSFEDPLTTLREVLEKLLTLVDIFQDRVKLILLENRIWIDETRDALSRWCLGIVLRSVLLSISCIYVAQGVAKLLSEILKVHPGYSNAALGLTIITLMWLVERAQNFGRENAQLRDIHTQFPSAPEANDLNHASGGGN